MVRSALYKRRTIFDISKPSLISNTLVFVINKVMYCKRTALISNIVLPIMIRVSEYIALLDRFPSLPCANRDQAKVATDCTLTLTTVWVRVPAWACEKVASDVGLGGGFRQVLRFPTLLTTG